MTYAVNNTILASDYQNFRGSIAPNSAYGDNASATGKVAALIGVGYGTRGYGQTSVILPSVSVGSPVTANNWNVLRDVMTTLDTHTGSALVLQPVVAKDQLITAQDGTSSRKNIASLITTLDTNRLNAAPAEMTLTSVLTSQRTSNWTTDIYHEFYVNFSTENNARYFFNSGGEVRLAASRTGGTSSAINTAITTMLTAMGVIRFGATQTTYTGTGGFVGAIGYFDLTDTYQQCFTHAGPAGTYSNISYTVTAKRENYAGLNGGNGSQIRFRATFGMGGYSGVTANGTLTSSISSYRSTGVVSIAAPSYATTVSIGP